MLDLFGLMFMLVMAACAMTVCCRGIRVMFTLINRVFDKIENRFL